LRKAVRILGTRGIPARHGGFESFTEPLALDLVERGWDVAVYCQAPHGTGFREETWRGVRLVHIPARGSASVASVAFDFKSTLHAARSRELALVMGYNTALFSAWYRLKGIPSLMNMDGLDLLRPKWRPPVRQFFQLNERLGCILPDQLIADHPAIAEYLATRVPERKITMIPYGSNSVRGADPRIVEGYGLLPGRYCLVVCRPESGHSLEEVVRAFSRRERSVKLVILGGYDPDGNEFHRRVVSLASREVVFPGAIYDKPVVEALRFHAMLYIHGHCFGGTNPSLVEALGAGSPVLARDNKYNRWVAGPAARFFGDEEELARELDRLLEDGAERGRMAEASRRRHAEEFAWEKSLERYESLLLRWLPS
jgi:glycosyltransferase involved in cell wall biosynthesis